MGVALLCATDMLDDIRIDDVVGRGLRHGAAACGSDGRSGQVNSGSPRPSSVATRIAETWVSAHNHVITRLANASSQADHVLELPPDCILHPVCGAIGGSDMARYD